MTLNRRMAFGLAASAALAACRQRPIETPTRSGPMDVKLLDREFPALAERAQPGALALGVMNLQTTQTWYWNTDRAFPLAGAAALPTAAAVLAQLDGGGLSLGEPVRFGSLDLSPPPSLIDQRWPTPPDGHWASLSVSNLLTLMMLAGDNTAMDLLMRRVGGPGAVSAFLESKGVSGLRIDRYRREIGVDLFGMPPFRPAWKDPAAFDAARDSVTPALRQRAMDAYILDPKDSATVPAALGFLAMLANGELVSAASTDRLIGWMRAAPRGPLGRDLPPKTLIARTGGAVPTDLGFTAAQTEFLIAGFSPQSRYAIAAFLVGSTATEAARESLFADAGKLVVRAVG
jgi:beta-lactamase class A